MLQVTRNEPYDTTNVQTFSSRFYTKLIENQLDKGVNHVSSWVENRKIDIFGTKFVLLHINLETHWSLCVIVNLNKRQSY